MKTLDDGSLVLSDEGMSTTSIADGLVNCASSHLTAFTTVEVETTTTTTPDTTTNTDAGATAETNNNGAFLPSLDGIISCIYF